MRPKKIILCVIHDEQSLCELSYMLRINRYRAMKAATGLEAIAIFSEFPVDLVLADYEMPVMSGPLLVKRLKQIAPHIPMILLGDPAKMTDVTHGADALLSKKACAAMGGVAGLLARIKVMSARKRGPRKGTKRTVASVRPERREAVCA